MPSGACAPGAVCRTAKKPRPGRRGSSAVILGNSIRNFPALWRKTAADGFTGMCIGWRTLCGKIRRRVSSSAQKKCAAIEKGFDQAWRDKVIQMQIPCLLPPPRDSGACGLTVFWPRLWSWGRSGQRNRYFRPHWWSNFAASRPRAFPWRWWRRWRPTTLPTSRRIPTGWCCRWPTLTHTSAPPALGGSISSRSQRPFWSDLKQALDCAGIGWAAPLSLSRDRIRHPSPLLPLEMDACSFQNDSVRLPFPTPDGIRR